LHHTTFSCGLTGTGGIVVFLGVFILAAGVAHVCLDYGSCTPGSGGGGKDYNVVRIDSWFPVQVDVINHRQGENSRADTAAIAGINPTS